MDPDVPAARELAGYSLEAQHPLTRRWVDDSTHLDLLTEWHQLDVQLATDLDIAAVRVARFAPGHPPEAMLNRWVPVAEDLHAMLSMRYASGNPHKPFVDATPLSRPLRTDDLPLLARAADRTYGPLDPRYLRLWSTAPPGSFVGTDPDKRCLAAPIRSLREGFGQRIPVELAISPALTLDEYDQAQRAYDAVDTAYPEHPEQAALQDREDLQHSVSDGTLFDVTVDGTWAGYVAATIDSENLGLPARVVQEIILAPDFRGRGYGAHLSTLLARALPDQPPILIGSIHAANRGALQAAERAGRIDVGGWIQVELVTACIPYRGTGLP